jgi:hypothetical protein
LSASTGSHVILLTWEKRAGVRTGSDSSPRCRCVALRTGPPNFGLPSTAPFTVEGQIEREAALLAGAKRAHGWRRWGVYTFFAIAALAFGFGVMAGLVAAVAGS